MKLIQRADNRMHQRVTVTIYKRSTFYFKGHLFREFKHEPRQFTIILSTLDHDVGDISFGYFRHKPRQFIVEYYLQYTGPPRLRYLFQVVQTQSTTAYCRILPTLESGPPRLRYLFQVVQTQDMTTYCRILPTLNHHVWDIFFQAVQTQTTVAYCRILYAHLPES